jgi:hypothetical protein
MTREKSFFKKKKILPNNLDYKNDNLELYSSYISQHPRKLQIIIQESMKVII